jgi:hypothetical protein
MGAEADGEHTTPGRAEARDRQAIAPKLSCDLYQL